MKELAGIIIQYFGTATLMTVSNIYTMALTFYGALYMILWYFRRGERYKMFPSDLSIFMFVSLLCGTYLFGLGQYFDPSMEYYPFAFFSNLLVLCTIALGVGVWYSILYLIKLREKFPKQD